MRAGDFLNIHGVVAALAVATLLLVPANASDLDKLRQRASSDDAKTIDEAFFHANARALVIMNVEPNQPYKGCLPPQEAAEPAAVPSSPESSNP